MPIALSAENPAAAGVPRPSPSRLAALLALFAALVLLLSWPLLVLRTPVMFGDTAGYLYIGDSFLDGAGRRLFGAPPPPAKPPLLVPNRSRAAITAFVARHPELLPPGATTAFTSQQLKWPVSGGRSFHYGIIAATIARVGGWTAIAVAQTGWVALMLVLAIRRFGLDSRRQQVAAVLVLGLATSLGFFTAVLLPDVFGGFAVLGLILVALYGDEMPVWEWLFWLVSVLSILLFHKAFLMLGLLLVALMVAHALWRRRIFGRDRLVALLPAGIVAGLALAITLATNPLMARVGGPQIVDPPFLLARSIADGPAAATLREICPARAYLNCVVLPELPVSEEDFLWGRPGGRGERSNINWVRMPPDIRVLMAREQAPLLLATLQRYPGWQAQAALGNAARQFATAGLTQFEIQPHVLDDATRLGYGGEVARYRQGGIAKGDFPLETLSSIWAVSYGLSILCVVLLLVLGRGGQVSRLDPRIPETAALIVVALAINAVINGTFSGPFDRYQGRVSWLAVFALLLLLAHMVHARRAERQQR